MTRMIFLATALITSLNCNAQPARLIDVALRMAEKGKPVSANTVSRKYRFFDADFNKISVDRFNGYTRFWLPQTSVPSTLHIVVGRDTMTMLLDNSKPYVADKFKFRKGRFDMAKGLTTVSQRDLAEVLVNLITESDANWEAARVEK